MTLQFQFSKHQHCTPEMQCVSQYFRFKCFDVSVFQFFTCFEVNCLVLLAMNQQKTYNKKKLRCWQRKKTIKLKSNGPKRQGSTNGFSYVSSLSSVI